MAKAHWWRDGASGLRAVAVIDDTTLGPAAGGIRTLRYASEEAAERDARALARAMTLKCALGGVAAGGGKIVVMLTDDMDRPAAFAELGRCIERLDGQFRTAGDFGTTLDDLEAAAAHTGYVYLGSAMAANTARGLRRCIEACAALRGKEPTTLSVAIQGCGAIGGAVARELAGATASLCVADLDPDRAAAVAAATGARVVAADVVLASSVDVLAPCAIGGVIDRTAAERMRAWCLVGAANNILASRRIAEALAAQAIVHVPDVIASAGAVIDGVCRTMMGLDDPTPHIDALADTATEVLVTAERERITTIDAAEKLASARLGRAVELLV